MASPSISPEEFLRDMALLLNKPTFIESDFDRISELLLDRGKIEWSCRPRTYAVLWMINRVDLLNDFVVEGLNDIAFPYKAERLPDFLRASSVQNSFLDKQKLVLTDAKDLETDGGEHKHFERSPENLERLSRLGIGGYAEVYHVRSKLSRRDYAMKLTPRTRKYSGDKKAFQTIKNEMSNLKKLHHYHLVQLVGSYTDPNYFCLLMSPVADCNLDAFLNRQPFPEEDFNLLRSFYGCLASAVVYLHEKRTRHKDIKPTNILIKGKTVLITDFGISRDWSTQTQNTTTGIPEAYTKKYAAPEVINADPRNNSADIWSLGCVFIDMTTILSRETLHDKDTFFESRYTQCASPADNIQALQEWFSRERPKDCDIQPFEWIRGMLRKNPEPPLPSAISTTITDLRPTALGVFEKIRKCGGPYSYCGECCNPEVHDISGTHQRASLKEPLTPPKADQNSRVEEIASLQLTMLHYEEDLKIAARTASNGKEEDWTTEAAGVDDRPYLSISSTQDGSKEHLQLPSTNSDYEKAEMKQREEMIVTSSQNEVSTPKEAKGSSQSSMSISKVADSLPVFEAVDSFQVSSEPKKDNEPSDDENQKATVALLAAGFHIDSGAFKTAAAMCWAAENGDLGAVRLLLNNGASVETTDKDGNSVLHLAAQDGHVAVVRLLLTEGANIEARNNNGSSALHRAAQNCHEAVVRLLLEEGADVQARNKEGNSVLHLAAYYGHEAVFQLLLTEGANIEARNKEGNSVLHLAAYYDHKAVFRLLLTEGADIEARNNDGFLVLHLAAQNGHEAIVRLLLMEGANVQARNEEGNSVLHLAAYYGHEAVSRLLLMEGADIEARNNDGFPVLHLAAQNGHEAVFRLLVEKGVDFKATDSRRCSALHWAAYNGHEAVVRLLLRERASIKATDMYGNSALNLAAQNGHEAVVRLLLEEGADIEAGKKEDSVLHLAARNGHEAAVRLLLTEGADIEARDNYGNSVLHCAAQNGHEAVVRLLLTEGADIKARTLREDLPLHLAAGNGHQAVVRLLLKEGADIEARTMDGRSALHLAAYNGYEAVVRLLLTEGANIEARNKEGNSVLHLAAYYDRKAVFRLLVEHGAKPHWTMRLKMAMTK